MVRRFFRPVVEYIRFVITFSIASESFERTVRTPFASFYLRKVPRDALEFVREFRRFYHGATRSRSSDDYPTGFDWFANKVYSILSNALRFAVLNAGKRKITPRYFRRNSPSQTTRLSAASHFVVMSTLAVRAFKSRPYCRFARGLYRK